MRMVLYYNNTVLISVFCYFLTVKRRPVWPPNTLFTENKKKKTKKEKIPLDIWQMRLLTCSVYCKQINQKTFIQ